MADVPPFEKIGEAELLGGEFLKTVRQKIRYSRFDGSPGGEEVQEVLLRPDAAAILLYNETIDAVVLVTQFRFATTFNANPRGWLIELPAGQIESGEQPAEVARREAKEETGYLPNHCEHIGTVYASPGGTSERIHIYFASVNEGMRVGEGRGTQHEHVVPFPVTLPCLWGMMDRGEISDAKLLIAAQWLRLKRGRAPRRSPALPSGKGKRYRLKTNGVDRWVGYETGDIADIARPIDVWVNSENTDMLMARFFGGAISGTIRYLGAAKYPNGDIREDTIANALRKALAGQPFVRPGDIVVTESGDLLRIKGVRTLFHAAAVHAQRGFPEWGALGNTAECTRKALLEIEGRNKRWYVRKHRSILFPLFGTGIGGLPVDDVAELMVAIACKHLRKPDSTLREIYFAAYNETDRNALDKAISRIGDLELETPPPTATKPANA